VCWGGALRRVRERGAVLGEAMFRFMPMPRKQTMQHEESASKKAHGEPRSSRKAEKPKSEARAGGHVTAWLARFFVLRGSVSRSAPPN